MRALLIALFLLPVGCKPADPAVSGAASARASSVTSATPTATQQKAEPGLFAAGFRLHAAEPFWTLAIDPQGKEGFSFQPMDGDVATTKYATPILTGDTQADFTSGDFAITLVKDACSDGMADEIFSYTAVVTVAGKTMKGCAHRIRPVGEPDWTAIVPEALPIIDACLAKGQSTQVTLTRRVKGDVIQVYVDAGSGSRFVCDASLAAPAKILDWERVEAGTNAEDERDPMFVRAVRGATPGRCGNETAVKDKAGKLLGWKMPNEEC